MENEKQEFTNFENKPANDFSELLKETRKQTFYTRLHGICMAGFFLVILIVALLLVPKALVVMDHANDTLVEIDSAISTLENSLTNLDLMSAEIVSVSKNLNEFVGENGEIMNETMTEISNMDFEGLNNAIKDLQAVVEPLAKLMGRFR